MKYLLLSFFLLILTSLYSFENNPYYLENGRFEASLSYKFFSLTNTFLDEVFFSFAYGVNDRVYLKFFIPYIFFEDKYQDGILGDIYLKTKFLLEKDFEERWSISFIPEFRFPTGVVQEDSYRYVNGKRVSFYPYSYGIFAFYPGFNASLFIPPFMLWMDLFYCSENSYDEEIFSFNSSLDRLEIDINVDYLFELNFFADLKFYYQPQLSVLYRYNISREAIIPDNFEFYFCNFIKAGEFFKFRLGFLYPINQEGNIYKYSFDFGMTFIF
ncbi:MAG: hypothetical protein ACP5QT_02490 [Brevinematia bacterium]